MELSHIQPLSMDFTQNMFIKRQIDTQEYFIILELY